MPEISCGSTSSAPDLLWRRTGAFRYLLNKDVNRNMPMMEKGLR